MNKMHEESLITKFWDCVNMFFILDFFIIRKLLLSTNAAN